MAFMGALDVVSEQLSPSYSASSCGFPENILKTRMHSSRMRTVRSSGHLSGGSVCVGVSAPEVGGLRWGGVCLLLEGSAPGGVCCRGVCSQGRGVCSWGSVCSRGGGCLLPGASALGGCIPPCTEADTPYPPCGQTDTCKNITFATSLRTVIIG